MSDIKQLNAAGVQVKYIDMGDSFAERVVATNPDGSPIGGGLSGGASDREITITHYRVKTAFSEGSVGDVVTFTQFYDAATIQMVGAIWANQTTNTELTTVPMANFEIIGVSRGSYGAGVVDATTQRVTLASDGPIVTAVGNTTDAAATTDAGTFSIISLLKRGLSNWTSLLAKLPTLIGGRIPTDVLGVLLSNQAAASSTTAAAFALGAGTKRVSLQAATYNARFAFGASSAAAIAAVGSVTASLRVLAGAERDFAVPAGATHLAYVREATATNDIEMAELT